ncbi:MAG: acyl carrier protein [Gammaproteobacteria bacterium]|nr:acyl carrier protein [Gammaproteobacteria bacterium]
MATVEERIFELAQENLDLGRDPDWDLTFGESDVSSMDAVAFIKLLDKEFGIEIPPEDLAEVDTMRKLAKVVAGLAG